MVESSLKSSPIYAPKDREQLLNKVVDNKVYILGEFDSTISEFIVPALADEIEKLKGQKDPFIEFYINSIGGSAYELFSLLSLMDFARLEGIKIITKVIGIAHSCGSLLAVYGDERYMCRWGTNLMHYGTAYTAASTPLQVERQSLELQEHFKKIEKIYAEHTKLNIQQIRSLMKDDSCYLQASECLKNGLCDLVVG